MVEPATGAQVVSILKDVVVACAAVTGATVAVLGLKTWRRQLQGQAQYELARRYLRAVLNVRDAIRGVRAPFMSAGEIFAAMKEAGLDPDADRREHLKQQRAAYSVRMNRLNQARSDLRVEALEAEVLWGKAAQELLLPLDRAIGELFASLYRYLDSQEPNASSSERQRDLQAELRGVVYQMSDDPKEDKFGATVQSAVDSVERFVSPHLQP
jgi:hypothetical protein